jgi:hypothetical protein
MEVEVLRMFKYWRMSGTVMRRRALRKRRPVREENWASDQTGPLKIGFIMQQKEKKTLKCLALKNLCNFAATGNLF